MSALLALTKRNLLIFFRNRAAVFFSLLAAFIIIGLYVLFLGNNLAASFSQYPQAKELTNNWVMAGLLAVTSVTTTMGAFSTMIQDKTNKISKDFYSSPVRRRDLAGGYVLSAFLIGFIMTMVTLVLAEIYIVAEGGALLSPGALIKVILLILLADLANTAMMFFLTSFFESQSAFSTASTVLGTLIGFITGIYLPVGVLPGTVQTLVKIFPPSHAAVLMRQTMMEAVMNDSFAHVPVASIKEFKEIMGVTFQFGGHQLSSAASVIILLASAAVFFALAVLNVSRKKERSQRQP